MLAVSAILLLAPQGDAPPPVPLNLAVLREHHGETKGSGYGFGLAFLGDVDRDGTIDYAIGAPRDLSRPESEGAVTVHSGKSGRVLFAHRGEGHGTAFGFALAGGDCDGDGIADVVVGAPYASKGELLQAGSVQFFSGKDGRLLREISGRTTGESFGWAIVELGDVDRDRVTDYAIGAPFADRRRNRETIDLDAGRVDVISGKTGKVLWSAWGEAAEDRFGSALASVEDCNADGAREVLVGAEGARKGTERPGSATLLSGRTGSKMVRLTGDSGTYFGTAVCSLGDLDGDRQPELAIGAWNAGEEDHRSGEVRVCSGRTGKVLHVLRGAAHLDQFGRALAPLGDFDGDGVVDLAIGAPGEGIQPGYVRIVSGKTFTTLLEQRGTAGERFGITLRAADLDGDGAHELLVGAGVADVRRGSMDRAVLFGRNAQAVETGRAPR